MNWLGLKYQEGPEAGGDYGPYRQSERTDIYKKYLEKLIDEGKAYYCFCPQEEIKAHKEYLMSIGQPSVYSGKCRKLSPEEVEENIKKGKSYVIRLKTSQKEVVFKDMLRGEIKYHTSNFGDFVIAKDLESPLYNFAVVVDDQEMKISHVIRGEDHIPNTSKQIIIAESLGWEIPKYLHLPLILGPDKSKLSKRDNIKSLLEYREEGYLPEAFLNFLALLGWNPDSNREVFSLPSLIKEFTPEKFQKSGAIFNPKKLSWLNSFYIRQKSPEKLTALCIPYLLEKSLIKSSFKTEKYPPAYGSDIIKEEFEVVEREERISFSTLQKIVSLYQERLNKLSEISELTDYFFKKELDYNKEILKWKDMNNKEIKNNLDKLKKKLSKIKKGDWNEENLKEELLDFAKEAGEGDRGRILWPFRASLTGKKASAGPFEISDVLGREKTLERINKAQEKL